jgi:transcriptional regulator with XRE-family HTH domain
MKDRIAKLLKSERMTAAKLADEIGVQASGISHILSGRNNPSTDFIVKLLERFRGINAEWLLMGKGNMYKTTAAVEIQPEITPSKASHSDLFNPPVQQEVKYPDNKPVENTVFVQENASPSTEEKVVLETKTTQPTFQPEHQQPERKVKKVVVLFNDGTFDYYDSFK